MSNDAISMNPNPLVQALGKPAADFTKADIISFMKENEIQRLNLRYVAGDGRLKNLSFVVQSEAHLDKVLTMGERVDGSSLFPFVAATSSDLYVVPRFRTAFLNPFGDEPAVDLLCSFYDVEGKPLDSAPENILRKAQKALQDATGTTLEALGELEFYVMSEIDETYPITPQKGYHEGHPFAKWADLRNEAMGIMASMGCHIKYGHAEVGNIVHEGRQMVQQEIEMLPVPIERAADEMAIAKWVLREVAYSYGVEVSFAPKIIVGHAGSGMHFHTRLMKDGKNLYSDEHGLTDTAKKVIAGFLMCAESLTAFGNTVPTSYLRLVPHQEAPTSICWGDRNRSALVRVPLGWNGIGQNMLRDANPNEPEGQELTNEAQTAELRSPDGSANVHLLLAAMACAARIGLTDPNALEFAQKTYISKDASEIPDLAQLPASCVESARALLRDRAKYEAEGVFPAGLIDATAANLTAFDDENLSERLYGNTAALLELVNKYQHCG